MDHAIEKSYVLADDVVEGERGELEVIVAEIVLEGIEFSADMPGDHLDKIAECHSVREAARSLLNIEEVMADVVVAIRLVQHVVEDLPAAILVVVGTALEHGQRSVGLVLPRHAISSGTERGGRSEAGR